QPVQDLTVDARVSRNRYQYQVESADSAEVARWVPRLTSTLTRLPELREVSSDAQNDGLVSFVTIHPDTPPGLGAAPTAVTETLYAAFGQRQISIIFTQANQYRVVLEVAPEFRSAPANLAQIYVRGTGTDPVPIGTLTRQVEASGPLVITRSG